MARLSFDEIDAQLASARPSFAEIDENLFRRWYAERARRFGLSPDPDDPQHRYDYRAAFRASAEPDPKTGHWPSRFKADDHPNRYVGILDTKTGRPRQIPGAAPGLGRVEQPSVGERLTALGDRAITAAAEGVVSLPELAATVAGAVGPKEVTLPGGAVVESPWARLSRKGVYPTLGEPGGFLDLAAQRQDIRRQYEEAKERVREMPSRSPFDTAVADTLAEAAGVALPVGFGAGRARSLETAGQRTLRKAIGGQGAAEIVAPAASRRAVGSDLEELARVSLGIEESPAATRRVASVVDAGGEGAVRRLAALDEAGEMIGGMTYTREPGGGFRVLDVATGERGTGAGRAMYRRAAEIEGPYRGSSARTPEGEGFVARLRKTDPEIFAEPSRARGGAKDPLFYFNRRPTANPSDPLQMLQGRLPDKLRELMGRPWRTYANEFSLAKPISVPPRPRAMNREALALPDLIINSEVDDEAVRRVAGWWEYASRRYPRIAASIKELEILPPGSDSYGGAGRIGVAADGDLGWLMHELTHAAQRARIDKRPFPLRRLYNETLDEPYAVRMGDAYSRVTQPPPAQLTDEAIASLRGSYEARRREAVDQVLRRHGQERGVNLKDGQEGSVGTGPLASLRDWWTENFTGGGPSAGKYRIAAREIGGKATPEGRFALSIPKRIEAMEGRVKAATGQAQDLIEKVEPLVKKAASSPEGQKALWKNMQKAASGEVPLENIPEALRPFVARRQDLVEALQRRGIDTGAFPDDMVEAVSKSGGAYSHRTYRAFKDPKHYEKTVDTPDWYALKDFLRKEMPDASDDALLGYMKQIVKREQGTKALEVAHAPTRLNRILRERQNLPEPIRRAMGEETDFRAVLSDTVYQMAHDIEAHNFWKEVGDEGLAAGAFRTAEQGPTEMVFRRIPGSNSVEGISSRGPVEGLLSPEALKDAIVGQFEAQKASKWWNRFAAGVNIGKTVGGFPTGHVRNFLAHHATSAVNGKNPGLAYTRWKDIAAAYRNPVTLTRMRELGIAGQGASSQEVFDFARMLEEEAKTPLARGWGRFGRKLGKSWGAGDDVWRAAHWMDETDQLAWANPQMSRPEVEAWAADRVKDTFQTYSRAPEYARKLRRTPFGGPGVTFHAESLRNVKNIAKTAAGDIATGIRTQNPRMVVLGMRRAAGLMAGPAAIASIPAASRMMSGMDREAQEAARRQAEPYYHQNAEQLVVDFKPGESFSYVDISFLNPYSALSKTAIATQRAVTQGQPPVEAIAEFLDQVSGGDIATKELLQLALNKPIKTVWPLRTYETQIGNFDEGAGKATGELAYHAYRGLAPGGIVQLENVARGAGALPQREEGRERTLATELPAYLGFRVTTQKIPEALRRNLGAIGSRVRGISPKPPKDPALVPQRAADYLDSWERLYGEVRTLVEDFDRMGMTPQKMRQIAATTAAPQSMLKAAMRGDERAPSPITVSAWGQLPESWTTPERLPFARAILAEWRKRYAER